MSIHLDHAQFISIRPGNRRLWLAASFGLVLACAMPLRAQYTLLHGFENNATDGGTPGYGASVVASGTTLYGMTQAGGSSSNGVLFKINTSGSGYQVLHHFNGYILFLNPGGSKDDGAQPYGTPVLDGATLYGTTATGGSNGFGTVFSINTDGSGFQALHHFGGNNDGTLPYGSLILDGTTLYGTTSSGGSNNAQGVVFKLETNGTGYQTLHHFTPGINDDCAAPWGGLAKSGTTLYGMAWLGGTGGLGSLFKLEADGTGYQILHHFIGGFVDGAHPYGSLIVDGTTLYGMTKDGGINNAGTVFRINTDGSGLQLLHEFALSEAYNPYGDLIRSGTILYGMTKAGVTNGLGAGAIFQLNTDGTGYQRLHTFMYPVVQDDGMWPHGALLLLDNALYGMTQLGGGFLPTPKNGTVFKFALGGGGGGGGSGGGGEPSLSGTLSGIKQKCKTKNEVTTCSLSAALALLNSGDGEAPATHVRFFLSENEDYEAGEDTLIGEATTKNIKVGKAGKAKLKAATPGSSTGLFLLAVDDSDNVLASLQIQVL